ncbi:right origin-binding protein [Desulfosporosinus acididurans]|uniref:Right origin-binding protein n=1 Tax=Desulfosporosinus acididurans TaxID=476652 RepID=A0A0J1FSA8_9FIRM|nr:AraC family transcriptional regulator [Desulfosporosinus acididurans]KLU66177.1 right origin-binding protein [Desulfosporosinus acididurans]
MNYSQSIQDTITYIEQHLCERLSLDEIVKVSGFSKYHFVRIFKREIGLGLKEHIQSRRLTLAAKLLLSSKFSIMDIALYCRFESQEAFTRAFKKVYALPPGKYRRAINHLVTINEVNDMKTNEQIPGWIITGTAPGKFEAAFDHEVFFKGTKSVLLKSTSTELETGDYYAVMQQFKAKNYLGKRVRLSGFLKARDVTGWGGLWMRIDSITANVIKIDNMQNRPITGDTDWNHYSVVLDVPENSAIINIGMLLNGTGELWMDNVSFDIVDKNVPATDVDLSSELPEKPMNLSFEEDN